jgi:hypothetical protein
MAVSTSSAVAPRQPYVANAACAGRSNTGRRRIATDKTPTGLKPLRPTGLHQGEDSNPDVRRLVGPGGHDAGQVGVRFGCFLVERVQGACKALLAVDASVFRR